MRHSGSHASLNLDDSASSGSSGYCNGSAKITTVLSHSGGASSSSDMGDEEDPEDGDDDGIEKKMTLEPRFDGNAYALETDRVPHTLQMARDLWANSDWAKETFGADVHKHYTHMADTDILQFNQSITDFERIRGFERY